MRAPSRARTRDRPLQEPKALPCQTTDNAGFLLELQRKLGDGGWGEGVIERAGGDGDGLGLGRHYLFLVEGVVGVDVGMGEGGGYGGFDAGVVNDDFGFAGIADGGIHHGQDDLFVVKRGGAFQAPERGGLAVAVVGDGWGAELGANSLPSLVIGVHS